MYLKHLKLFLVFQMLLLVKSNNVMATTKLLPIPIGIYIVSFQGNEGHLIIT